jgi:hypothetical protein
MNGVLAPFGACRSGLRGDGFLPGPRWLLIDRDRDGPIITTSMRRLLVVAGTARAVRWVWLVWVHHGPNQHRQASSELGEKCCQRVRFARGNDDDRSILAVAEGFRRCTRRTASATVGP